MRRKQRKWWDTPRLWLKIKQISKKIRKHESSNSICRKKFPKWQRHVNTFSQKKIKQIFACWQKIKKREDWRKSLWGKDESFLLFLYSQKRNFLLDESKSTRMNFHSIISELQLQLQLQFWFVCSFVCLFVCLVWGPKLAPNFYKTKKRKEKNRKTGNKKCSTFKLKQRARGGHCLGWEIHGRSVSIFGHRRSCPLCRFISVATCVLCLCPVSYVLRPQSAVSCMSCPVLGAIKFHFIKQWKRVDSHSRWPPTPTPTPSHTQIQIHIQIQSPHKSVYSHTDNHSSTAVMSLKWSPRPRISSAPWSLLRKSSVLGQLMVRLSFSGLDTNVYIWNLGSIYTWMYIYKGSLFWIIFN